MTPESIAAWIAVAPDESARELRRAVHTILAAVAAAPTLPGLIVLKGGILLALEYQGDRFTKDVDFSVRQKVQELAPATLVDELRNALALQVEVLDYGLDCRVQGHELMPPGEDRTWPTLKIRVGYAPKSDTSRHGRLQRLNASNTVSIDISYNEVITAIDILDVPGGGDVRASSLSDLLAEKFRAMLQQPVRNRTRRQNLYDIYRLLPRPELAGSAFRAGVLEALHAKSEGRGIAVEQQSLSNPAVKERSFREYAQLTAEIASELPDFGAAYAAVQAYYEQLPWPG
jgi:predicted nucleotidyltransferase component of viral defense system